MPWVVGTAGSESFVSKSLATGLTFTRTSSYVNGSAVTFAPTFSEVGSGSYRYVYTPIAIGPHEWIGAGTNGEVFVILFDVLSAAADPAALATAIAAVAAKTDVATSTRAVAGAVITASSPVTSQGSIELIQGDDYAAADDRALTFNLTGTPDLTDATATLVISWGVDSVSVSGVITNAATATQTVKAELTAEQTTLMPITGTTYQLRAVLANTNVVTLKRGRVLVQPPTPAN